MPSGLMLAPAPVRKQPRGGWRSAEASQVDRRRSLLGVAKDTVAKEGLCYFMELIFADSESIMQVFNPLYLFQC